MLENQIYEYPNKANLEDNDLFLISDEGTIDHQLKNITASQARNYFFNAQTATGVYTPTFGSLVGVTSITNTISAYTAASLSTGNWVQVTINATVTFSLINASFVAKTPLGGLFQTANDSIFVGGAVYIPSGTSTALSPFLYAQSISGSNTVQIGIRIPVALVNTQMQLSFSFTYKLY